MIKASLVLEGGATRGVFTSGALAYLMEKKLADFFVSFDVSEVYMDTRKINYIENPF